jgi:cardiolipin synthase
VRWATWALFGRLLKGGVEIYEYQGRVMHAKTAVIDGEFASIGTHNLDHRSLRFNLEVAVNVFGAEFGGLMTRMFEDDLTQCRRVSVEDLKARSFRQVIVSEILYGLRYWL